MAKHTNKDTNRLCVTFEHPEILQDFNDYFKTNYGTVRGYRLHTLEELIANFNKTKKIQEDQPDYYMMNQELQEENLKLQEENNHLKQQLTHSNTQLTNNIKDKDNEIKELKQQLQEYTSLQEDNIRLSETIKKYKSDIDHYKENTDYLKQQIHSNASELAQVRADYTLQVEKVQQLNTDHIRTLQETNTEHENTINQMKEEHIHDLKEKEKEYKLLVGYTFQLKDEITVIKGLKLWDRVFKRYPEEVKELNP